MTKKSTKITPPNRLKQKVGSGGLPEYLLKTTQEYVDSAPIDYTPQARRDVDQFGFLSDRVKAGSLDAITAHPKMLTIVMQLKANGGMFGYPLVSETSAVLLRFLDKTKTMDEDFFEIIDTYIHVLNIIINKKLRGLNTSEGLALAEELSNACARYEKRHGK
ncbi:MAG: hypothetical protein DI626_08850 [Micavibrio aeruginosavorus]|uniref:Uncharacterized protein n=1 Tax=Micavibrio aeruginosavorus TaxID=349221 RepID=A0A2W4ZSG8_9BACT|nr:MAG: hypothetical protein DI626_08850 [Micavibrio aeruginosavorus]